MKSSGLTRHELADRLVSVDESPSGVEPRVRGLRVGHGVEDLDPLGRSAQAARRHARFATDDDRVLAGGVGVDHGAVEPLGEGRDVGLVGLVAEHQPQRVVGVIGPLRGGQHVGERLAHVVGVGGAVAAHIGNEL